MDMQRIVPDRTIFRLERRRLFTPLSRLPERLYQPRLERDLLLCTEAFK
jgi:hypothetical protein